MESLAESPVATALQLRNAQNDKKNRHRWIGFSEDDVKSIAEGASYCFPSVTRKVWRLRPFALATR